MARVVDISKLDNVERRELAQELLLDLSDGDLVLALEVALTSEQKQLIYDRFGETLREDAD